MVSKKTVSEKSHSASAESTHKSTSASVSDEDIAAFNAEMETLAGDFTNFWRNWVSSMSSPVSAGTPSPNAQNAEAWQEFLRFWSTAAEDRTSHNVGVYDVQQFIGALPFFSAVGAASSGAAADELRHAIAELTRRLDEFDKRLKRLEKNAP